MVLVQLKRKGSKKIIFLKINWYCLNCCWYPNKKIDVLTTKIITVKHMGKEAMDIQVGNRGTLR